MTVDENILGMTTIINSLSTAYGFTSQGTGFFYSELDPNPTGATDESGNGWHAINAIWLITNRHVAFPKHVDASGNTVEVIPESFTFNFREVINGKMEWLPVTLSKDELIARTKLHNDPNVDVVAIKIDDLQIDIIKSGKHQTLISSCQVTNFNLPSAQPLTIEATSDIICCSYPHGFYDSTNKFPIIKSGIVASSWGKNFNGNPTFLIDAKLFPGSSGGLVITKPTDIAVINGKLMKNNTKQFVFLGVYSGEYYRTTTDAKGNKIDEYYGLGIVWYSNLISDIVANGISYTI